ncbi:hypothetical protein RQP50_02025 [Paenibacillus sp. chi10]|uniref:Uncharacterized protein n=1 Tax=Paenibacillus suaedae TaxID=3077233 RepID=A0AAJ2N2S9_9BACL|nr:hypothetical protein [Paenibacillus sp. chi10]MDT8975016.1 hypothetical protein [Paenibacillus sp. chi10]
MGKMSEHLDYEITDSKSRLKSVQEIISNYDEDIVRYFDEVYNPHIGQHGMLSDSSRVAKDLESLANYLLYTQDSDAASDTITAYRKKRNQIRESAIEKIIVVEESKKESSRSIIKIPKLKVLKEDRLVYAELKETGKTIEQIDKLIKTRTDSKGLQMPATEIKKLKWIRTDIQKDEIAVKNELKQYIRFNKISKIEKDNNQLSYIRFDDIEIVRTLFECYTELKEKSYEDTHGYLKLVMLNFEELMDHTVMKNYMKDVFMWKIEGCTHDIMIERLNQKYQLKMTKPALSKMTRDTIPSMLVETYKQSKEDWLYTYILRGKYKTCNCCRQSYIASTKYFSPMKNSKSGLRSICKQCRKSKYRESCHTTKAK